jgi:hypothetical protein
MPTRRNSRRGRSSAESSPMFDKALSGMKNAAKKGMEGYLRGTQKAADYISSKLPESATRGTPGRGRRGGGRSTRGE